METIEGRYMGQDKIRVPCHTPMTKVVITSIESVEFRNEGEHLWKGVLGVDGCFKVTATKNL